MKWEKIIIFFLIIGYVSLNLRLKSTQYQMERMTEFMKKGHPIFNDPRWAATHGSPGPPGRCQNKPIGTIGDPGPIGEPGPIGSRGRSGNFKDDAEAMVLDLENDVKKMKEEIRHLKNEIVPFRTKGSSKPDDWDDELDGEWMEMPALVNAINLLREKDFLSMNNIADINTRIRKSESSGEVHRSVEFMVKQATDTASGKTMATVVNHLDGRLLKLNKAIKDTDFDTRSFAVKELRSLENKFETRMREVEQVKATGGSISIFETREIMKQVMEDSFKVELTKIKLGEIQIVPGIPGEPGEMGAMGAKGDAGKDGENGRPGECPFPVWQITQIVDKRLKEKISFND